MNVKRFVIERRIVTVTTLEVVASDLNEAMSYAREFKLSNRGEPGILGFSSPKEEGFVSMKRRKDLEPPTKVNRQE